MGCVSTRKLHFRIEKTAWSFIFLGANTKAPSSGFLHALLAIGTHYERKLLYIPICKSGIPRSCSIFSALYASHSPIRRAASSARYVFLAYVARSSSIREDSACNRGPRSDTLGRSISGVKITFLSRVVHVVSCRGNVRERRDSRSSWFSSWSRAGASGSACGACYGDAWSPGPGCAADSAWSVPECRLGARPRDGPGPMRSRWTCNRSCSPDGGQLSAGTVEFVRYTSN